jgi:hypothetical protein
VDRGSVLDALRGFPERLADAARRAAAGPPPLPGEWGPSEVVRHLIAVETDVHQARLHDLATVADPHWDWVEPGPWPGEPGLTLEGLLDRFAGLRTSTLAIVDALDEDGWARTGTHSRLGIWDVAGLLANAVDHDEDHLRGL